MVVIVAIILAVAFLGIIGLIYLRRKFDFVGTGHQLGHYLMILMDKYPVEMNLAVWDEVDDSDLDLLEKSPEKEFEIYADVMRQMRKEETIFIYTAKITDDSEVEDELGRRTFIVSPYDLDDKESYFMSQKARFTWRSLLQKERTRIVETFSPVDVVTVYNQDKNEDDWIFIVPVPRKKPKTNVVGFDSRVITKHAYYIEARQITNTDKLAYGSSYMPYVIKTKKEFDQLIKENKVLEEIVEEKTAEVTSKQAVIDRKNRKLGAKEWVILGKKELIREMKINMVWVMAGVMIGAIFPQIMESYIPNQTTALLVGILLGMTGLGLAYHFAHRKKKESREEEGVTVEEVSR